MKSQHTHPIQTEIALGLVFLLLSVVGVTGWWTKQATQQPIDSQQYIVQLQPQTYWLLTENEQTRLVPLHIAVNSGSKQEALKAALNNLLNNPQTHKLSTTIPAGTKLLDLRVANAGIYVNLSDEFSLGAGTTSMIYRLAQVLYTATSLDPEAKVYISIAGQLIDENYPLAGVGLVLTKPMTREQFLEYL
jgi:spore germination protein GerM